MPGINSTIRLNVVCSLLAAVFFSNSVFAKDALNFSRIDQQLPSPDGLYVIRNLVAATNKNSDLFYVETPDALVFTTKNARTKGKALLKYHRNVDVFWAPDSKAFVVNDWRRNNFCDALLYSVGSLHKPTSLRKNLLASGISAEERAQISNEEYSYVFVDQWNKPTELAIKASGHYFLKNKTVTYTIHYLWDMKSNRWKRLKRESRENLERGVPNMAHFGS